MSVAFLLRDYVELLLALQNKGYSLGPVKDYFLGYTPPFIFLRHDVDRFSARALNMATAERCIGVTSTYYFRSGSGGEFPCEHIMSIASMGHEIGFHYESVTRDRGDRGYAVELFEKDLASLRRIADVKTVAAHGSPLSKFCSMGYSATMDLERLELLGEPGVGFDFSKVLYVTDTGGVFGSSNNLRDWSNGRNLGKPVTPWELGVMLRPRSEPSVLVNSHPERWPSSRAGLIQARLMDGLANLMKGTFLGDDSRIVKLRLLDRL